MTKSLVERFGPVTVIPMTWFLDFSLDVLFVSSHDGDKVEALVEVINILIEVCSVVQIVDE